ncbi:MAG: glycosyltransferase family 2 protein [Candidatus Sumerlaeaceae bacterium]
MKLSVIIPVYNEESTIGEVIERVLKVPFEKEVIIVDDGSRDQTRTIVERSHLENMDEVKVFVTPTNFGKGAAIRIGLQFVTGDVVIIQDADLELDPAEYVNLVKPIQEGKADVVYGSRFLLPNAILGWKTRLVNRALATFTNLLYGLNITDESTCYKVFRTELIKSIPLSCVGFEFCPEVTAKIARLGHRIMEVPIGYHPRNVAQGKKLRLIRHGSQAIMTLLRYRFGKIAVVSEPRLPQESAASK